MNDLKKEKNRRILIIDDREEIHKDFRALLEDGPVDTGAFDQAEALLFNTEAKKSQQISYDIDSAYQGQEGLEMIKQGLVSSAHDCSDGGLAVALAECCISNKEAMLGAEINNLPKGIRPDALLFGETQSRVIISAAERNLGKIEQVAGKHKIPLSVIGKTTKTKRLKVLSYLNLLLKEIDHAWRNSLRM